MAVIGGRSPTPLISSLNNSEDSSYCYTSITPLINPKLEQPEEKSNFFVSVESTLLSSPHQNFDSNFNEDNLNTKVASKEFESPSFDKNDDISSDIKMDDEASKDYKVRGVCYCPSDKSWTAWWTEKGRNRKKAFKLSIHGEIEAKKLAIAFRKEIEKQLPELRYSKSERKQKVTNKNESHDKFIVNNQNQTKVENLGKMDIETSDSLDSKDYTGISSKDLYINQELQPCNNFEKPTKYNLRELIRAPSKSPEDYSSSSTFSNFSNKTKQLPRQLIVQPINQTVESIPNDNMAGNQLDNKSEKEIKIITNSDLFDMPSSASQLSKEMSDKDQTNQSQNNILPSPSSPKTNDRSPLTSINPHGIYYNRARETIVAFIRTPQGKKYKTFSTRNNGSMNLARAKAIKWKAAMQEQLNNCDVSCDSNNISDFNDNFDSIDPNTKERVRGISYSAVNKAWCAQWCSSTGTACLKSFSVSKYGNTGAKLRAMQQRQSLENSGQIGSRIPGVVFQDNSWKASWQENNGEIQSVTFFVDDNEMSYDCARRLAIACRKQKKKLTYSSQAEIYDYKNSFDNSSQDSVCTSKQEQMISSPKDLKMRKASSPSYNGSEFMSDSLPSPKRSCTTPQTTVTHYNNSPHHFPFSIIDTPLSTHSVATSTDATFSPCSLNTQFSLYSPDFSEIPRGVQYNRDKRAFFVSWYNEDHEVETKHFNIQFGYNSAKQMAIHYLKHLIQNKMEIKYSSPSQPLQSITPAATMEKSSMLPSSFTLDEHDPYSNDEKNSICFSLLGNALVDNLPPRNLNKLEHSTPASTSYASACSTNQVSQDNQNLINSKSHDVDDLNFSFSNTQSFVNKSETIPINSPSTSTPQTQSLLHRIQVLRHNDEENVSPSFPSQSL